MKIIENIKNFITRAKTKVVKTEAEILEFITANKDKIKGLMCFLDYVYDNYIGDEKMDKLIKMVIFMVNVSLKTSISTDYSDETLAKIKEALQFIYDEYIA